MSLSPREPPPRGDEQTGPIDDGPDVAVVIGVAALTAEVAALQQQVRELEAEVAAGLARVDYLTRGFPIGILEADAAGMIVTANEALVEMVGRDPVAEGLRSLVMIHPKDHDHTAKIFLSSLEPDFADDWTMDFRIVRPDGSIRWIRSYGRTHFAANGDFSGVLSTWLDITGEMTTRNSMERLVAMLNAIDDPVMIFDDQSNIVFTNPAAFDTLPPGSTVETLFTPATQDLSHILFDEAIPVARRLGHWSGELEGLNSSGVLVPYLVSLSVERDPISGTEYVTSISRDISALKRAEDVLRRQATRDMLTGLPNRRALFDLLRSALSRADRSGTILAVLFVDLDGFKLVNDEFGHDAGDDVLVELGRRISVSVRDGDTVARIGGDEFVVVCENLGSEADAEVVATRIVDGAAPAILVGSDQIAAHVGASVGIAIAAPGMTADDLVRAADGGVYAAKAAGRGRWARAS